MKKILFVSAAVSAVLVATPALAQTAVAAPTGARVEALVGYDNVSVYGENDDGALYGVGAGYDFAVSPSIAFGVDAEATDSTVKETDGFNTVKAGRDLYAGGRLTFPISNVANAYLKAGYTNARIKAESGTITGAANLDGFRVGAGAQFALSGKAYVGGEYRYSNYENDFSRHQVAMTLGTRF